jgi:Carboxypeptidase regulatory-like domain
MNKGRISTQVFLSFLMMILLMVTVGCSTKNDTYPISGTVTGASGVTMNLTGDATATTTTAADGTYIFEHLPAGYYTVIPVKAGYTFDPLCKGGLLSAAQEASQIANFTATANAGLTYSISGAVGTVSGAALAGVTITLTGDANAVTVTNASGNYSFPGIVLNGNYIVTPSLTGYTFSPTGTGVIISGADGTGINFTATANAAVTYSISGTVSGDAVAGVTITLSGGTFGTAITSTTGLGGTYSFSGLLPGKYTVTPSLAGYTFTAPISITLNTADYPGNNFTSTVVPSTFIYTISGAVSGAVTNGVKIYLTGMGVTPPATTSGGGAYSFPSLANGVYTVTPVLAGYTFAPASSVVTIAGGDISGTNFVATANAASYSISGTVSGEVKSGVTITLSGAGSGKTTTNGSGNYSFSGLVAGSYTVTPSLAGYTIAPLSLSPTIGSANVTGQNFVVGTAPTAFSQADLVGTWYMNDLRNDKWIRAQISINSSGVATCLSMSNSADSTGCPSPFDLTFTMNTATGVITQTGANAANPGTDHMTMTSNKNFAAGTATNGTDPDYKYQLVIVQKMGATYSNSDVQNISSFVYHQLGVGANNEWRYGTGYTTSGERWLTSETDSSGNTTTPGDTGSVISVATNGVVTMTGTVMSTYEGFLSDDKKTIVGTFSEDSGTTFKLVIIQVTGTEFTGAPLPLPAGVASSHMLGCGAKDGWIHDTITVAPGGGMTFSDWADSFGGSAPSTAYTGNITTTSGTLTIAEDPTYHGQISHDGKFIVNTQTGGTDPNFVYFLNVTTK